MKPSWLALAFLLCSASCTETLVDTSGDDETGAGGDTPSGAGGGSSAGGSTARGGAGAAGAKAGGSASGGSTAAAGSTGTGGGSVAPPIPGGRAAFAQAIGLSTTNGRQTFAFGYGNGGYGAFDGATALGAPLAIVEQYLSGLSTSGGWATWNKDSQGKTGYFVNMIIESARSNGAVPMFTLYQMISFQDGNGGLGCLNDTACMTTYFADLKNMFTRIGSYDTPVLLNVEPDLSGYAQGVAATPQSVPVKTTLASECATLPNNLVGFTSCLLVLRGALAPKLRVGFPPSTWLGVAKAITFTTAQGVGKLDFIVMQTLDRDIGCFEIQDPAGECTRGSSARYWTQSDFDAHLVEVRKWFDAYKLPIIWWQTPLGVPQDTPGRNPRTAYGYRDNRMFYFFGAVQRLADAGGLGVVFGAGQGKQTDIETDIMPDGSHQYRTYLQKYVAAPVPLD